MLAACFSAFSTISGSTLCSVCTPKPSSANCSQHDMKK
jgi:hypothetical protein